MKSSTVRLGSVPVAMLPIAAVVSGAIASSNVLAQGQGFALEEVVVTARKRTESMQEVPVAVSAFNGESLKALGITNIKDMEGVVPGLNMGGGGNSTKGDSNPYIRGVGQRETKVTIDTAVGTYIDGIYIGRAAGALMDAVDVQSMQVLRGPQGTLFGKNTTGGAIVIETTKPGPEFGGHVDITAGNLGRRNASGAINVPLIQDTLYGRLTVSSTKTDGYMENIADGSTWNDDDRMMAIGQLRWDANEDVVVDLLWSATKTRQKSRGQKCIFLGDKLAAAGQTGQSLLEDVYNTNTSTTAEEQCNASGADLDNDQFVSEMNDANPLFRQSIYEVDTEMVGLTVDWNMGELLGFESLSLKSITGWRLTEQKADEDLDGSGAALTGRIQPIGNETNQYSQEFQFTGSAMEGRLNATLGLYAFKETTDDDWLQDYAAYAPETTTPNMILLAQSNLTERSTDNEAWAVFGQLSYDFTEQLEVTLGIRYTEEERETSYPEGRVYLPSIGVGTFCPGGTCPTQINPTSGNLTHVFSQPGAVPFDQWQYGYDANGNGSLEAREVGQFGQASRSRKDDDVSPSLSIKYRASDDFMDNWNLDEAMTFVTLSKGFRSGGVVVDNGDFDGDGINDLDSFEPETVNNIEVGVKMDAFDSRLRANLAAYYTDYKDIQVTTVVPNALGIPLPAIDNAGKAIIQGLEGEFTLLPIEPLRLTASFAYTDADYKEYLVAVDATGDKVERADEPMPRVAEWTAFLSADFFIHTDSLGTIIPSVAAQYSSEIYHGFDRESFLVAEEITADEVIFYSARLTWQLPDDRTTVTLWGKNLTNEDDYLVGGVPLVGVARSAGHIYAEPRTYGLDISYVFGH
jgi:iron complex outermembrane receptor protein